MRHECQTPAPSAVGQECISSPGGHQSQSATQEARPDTGLGTDMAIGILLSLQPETEGPAGAVGPLSRAMMLSRCEAKMQQEQRAAGPAGAAADIHDDAQGCASCALRQAWGRDLCGPQKRSRQRSQNRPWADRSPHFSFTVWKMEMVLSSGTVVKTK